MYSIFILTNYYICAELGGWQVCEDQGGQERDDATCSPGNCICGLCIFNDMIIFVVCIQYSSHTVLVAEV